MKSVVYDFNSLFIGSMNIEKEKNYIFQYIKNRKLSNINHSHNFYEIIVVIDGSCTHVINEKEYKMCKDNFVILRPKDSHFFVKQSDDVTVIGLSVTINEFEKFCEVYKLGLKNEIDSDENPCIISGGGINIGMYTACSSILKNYSEYECKTLLSLLIKFYIDKSENNYDLPKDIKEAMKKMKSTEYLKGGISAFVDLSNYSRSHLTRIMRRCFNMSPHEYILNLRLDAACNALVLSRESIEEISESIGYSSVSHFNKIFKARFGVTPAELRKNSGFWTT